MAFLCLSCFRSELQPIWARSVQNQEKKLIERRPGDARNLLRREPVAAGFGEQDEAVQAAGQIAGERRGAVAQRDLARPLAALDGAQKSFLQPAETGGNLGGKCGPGAPRGTVVLGAKERGGRMIAGTIF